MNKNNEHNESASVLMTAMFTIALLALVLATTISIASQKYNTVFQASSWQESLQGAEAGVDIAMKALNNSDWTGWKTVSGSPPRGKPSGGSTAGGYPDSSHYNYIIPTPLVHVGEGNTTVSMVVTIDTGALPLDQNGNQWYRIRTVGTAGISGPPRVSSEKLDNRLRKISLLTDRVTGSVLSAPQVSRYVEVIAQPIATSIWNRAITMKDKIQMSGGSYVDSFDSSSTLKSTNGQYDITKRQSNGDVATVNSDGSDLGGMYVYGDLNYSGTPVKNTQNVTGTVSTPFNATVPDVSAPNWANGSYANYSYKSGDTLTAGTKSNPVRLKMGSVNISSGSLTINPVNSNPTDNYIEIWVSGQFQTSGSAQIHIDPLVHATIYVGGDVNISGGSFDNESGTADHLTFMGITSGNSTHQFAISGGSSFIGSVDAPSYNIQFSGSGNFMGALIGNSLQMSGGASLHYDEALKLNNTTPGAANYAFASWFEDTR